MFEKLAFLARIRVQVAFREYKPEQGYNQIQHLTVEQKLVNHEMVPSSVDDVEKEIN